MIIDYYEEVYEASRLMLRAAQVSDWDGLIAGERQCASTIARLQSCGQDPSLLDEAERQRAHKIICAILAHDAEIRNLTEPWLRQLEVHLGATQMSRKVAAAYHP